MTRDEKYGTRDLTYSRWHRRWDDTLTWMDIDACEYCRECDEPLMLAELAIDVGQDHKSTSILRRLAKRAELPAYLIFYKILSEPLGVISQFRVRQVSPIWSNEIIMDQYEFVNFLETFRKTHHCKIKEGEVNPMQLTRNNPLDESFGEIANG